MRLGPEEAATLLDLVRVLTYVCGCGAELCPLTQVFRLFLSPHSEPFSPALQPFSAAFQACPLTSQAYVNLLVILRSKWSNPPVGVGLCPHAHDIHLWIYKTKSVCLVQVYMEKPSFLKSLHWKDFCFKDQSHKTLFMCKDMAKIHRKGYVYQKTYLCTCGQGLKSLNWLTTKAFPE